MRFLRIIFWGGLILAAGAFWLNRSGSLFEDEQAFSSEEFEGEKVDWDELTGFHSLDLEGGYRVILHPGRESKVEAQGPEEALAHLHARVDGQTLEIEQDDRWKRKFKDKITLHVYADELRDIEVSGAVDLRSEHTVQTQAMDIDVSGAGKLEIAMEVQELDAEISGAGKYILSGSAEEIHFEIAGAGEVEAFDLQGAEVSIDIAGAGSAKVFATRVLKAQIAGAGNVIYDGNPSEVDQKIYGAGSVRPRHKQ